MQGEILIHALVAALAIGLLIALVSDLRSRKIANWLNIAIAIGAPLFWWATGLGLAGIGLQLGMALLVFVILLGLFKMGGIGGGDVKLLTALALWLPWLPYLQMLVIMSLVGALVTVAAGMWHIARRQKDKIAVPYGIAISAAGLWVLSTLYDPARVLASITLG